MRLSNQLWNYGAIGIFLLSMANIFLTIRLFHSSQSPTIPVINCVPAPAPQLKHIAIVPTTAPLECDYGGMAAANYTPRKSQTIFSDLNLKLGRWDRTRSYKIHENAFVGGQFTSLSDKFTVCIATQSSLERLGSLVKIANHWSGPISVGVFATGDEELYFVQLYLTYLRKCFPELINQMSFHLVHPRANAPVTVRLDVNINADLPSHENCNEPEVVLSRLARRRQATTKAWRNSPYPQNHMRNLARKGCQNDFVFLVDVDIIPSYGMAESLDGFLRKVAKRNSTEKVAYVIPTFEVDNRVNFPNSKGEVLALAARKLARPFHQKIFIYNQYATNFSRWATTKDTTNATHISYNVTNFEFLYEPFYVAKDDENNPEHDERFVGYGFTRNTQVYEMFVAGYQFQVLSPIFTCHPGLQNKRHQLLREQQNNRNRREFDGFKREVFARYHKDPLKMMVPVKKKSFARKLQEQQSKDVRPKL